MRAIPTLVAILLLSSTAILLLVDTDDDTPIRPVFFQQNDADMDGVIDADDYCPNDPSHNNTTMDAASAGCPDSDGDGISNWAENFTFGTDWNNSDTDNDTGSDGFEIFTNFSNPFDANNTTAILPPPVSFTLDDTTFDFGGSLTADWDDYGGTNFSRFLVYIAPFNFTTTLDVKPSFSTTSTFFTSEDISTANGEAIVDGVDYWAVVAVVDLNWTQNFSLANVGPAQSMDNFIVDTDPPAELTNVTVVDDRALNGSGGNVTVYWDQSNATDFWSYEVFIEWEQINNTDDYFPEEYIYTQSQTNVTVVWFDSDPIWIAVRAVDTSDNALNNTTVLGPLTPSAPSGDEDESSSFAWNPPFWLSLIVLILTAGAVLTMVVTFFIFTLPMMGNKQICVFCDGEMARNDGAKMYWCAECNRWG